MLALFFLMNVFMVFYTIAIKSSFRQGVFFWIILAEELFIWVWHITLPLFVKAYSKNKLIDAKSIAAGTFL
jgi:hypothetical protein